MIYQITRSIVLLALGAAGYAAVQRILAASEARHTNVHIHLLAHNPAVEGPAVNLAEKVESEDYRRGKAAGIASRLIRHRSEFPYLAPADPGDAPEQCF